MIRIFYILLFLLFNNAVFAACGGVLSGAHMADNNTHLSHFTAGCAALGLTLTYHYNGGKIYDCSADVNIASDNAFSHTGTSADTLYYGLTLPDAVLLCNTPQPPPVDCTSGTQNQFSLPKETFPSICIGGGNCKSTNVNGCLVTYGQPSDCYLSGELEYCNYTGINQGPADPLTPDNSKPFNVGINNTPSPTPNNCIKTATSVICSDPLPDPNNPNSLCADMNGEIFCLPDDPNVPDGCGVISGTTVCPTDPNNCITSNGQNICIQPNDPNNINPDNNSPPDGCITNGSRSVCVNDTVINNQHNVTTVNPDGSTVVITVGDNNIKGGGSTTVTTTTTADGNTTSSKKETTGDGGLSAKKKGKKKKPPERIYGGTVCPGVPACSGDPIDCAVARNTFAAKCSSEDIANQIFGKDSQPDKPTVQGLIMDGDTYDGTPLEFSAGLLNTSRFNLAGSCPAPRSYDVMNSSFTIDLSSFCTLASMIGVFVSIGSTLIAFRMVTS